MVNFFTGWFPSLFRWGSSHATVRQILARQTQTENWSDAELRRASQALMYRAQSGESLTEVLVPAYSYVREAAGRKLGMRHFPTQLLGGIALHQGSIAQMQTGEGKTLTATLPLYLAALVGKGAHLATVNDYLARRDAEWSRPLFELLGLSVGKVEASSSRAARRQAYAQNITYGTAKEFGFDFLRDRLLEDEIGSNNPVATMLLGEIQPVGQQAVQRRHFILVDEADSIMLDEARTPLIVSSVHSDSHEMEEALFRWACYGAPQFAEVADFEYDHKTRQVTLTTAGRKRARDIRRDAILAEVPLLEIYRRLECAIKVLRDYHREKQYVVRDGEIVIVDENTGRLAEGRKWKDGTHQAVEAKEALKISFDGGEAARITLQTYLRSYDRLCGMTGTATGAARELKRIYQAKVQTIPTHRPAIRQLWPLRVFGTEAAKWEAVVAEIGELHAQGRPVLVGTRTIAKSRQLSQLLSSQKLPHQVLNAQEVAQEAKIVEQAGEQGRITVATNMAGRGTDIRLGDSVPELGGLHVIGTEVHESSRIDRQLLGRCGRQGDPGSFRQYLSLEDEILLLGLGPTEAERLKRFGAANPNELNGCDTYFRRAQARVEAKQFRDRTALLEIERQRRKLQMQLGQNPYLDAVE